MTPATNIENFGPHPVMILWLFVKNLWAWLGSLGCGVIYWLKHHSHWGWLQPHILVLDIIFVVGIIMILASISWAIVVQANTKYQYFLDAKLMVKESGVWNKVSDSIMITMAFDCDILQNPLEQTTKSATIIIRTADGRITIFPFAISPERFREVVLSNKAGKFMYSV